MKWLLIAFSIIVGLFALFLYELNRPNREVRDNLVMSSITNLSKNEEKRANLIPTLLRQGMFYNEVATTLNKWKFEKSEKEYPKWSPVDPEKPYYLTRNGSLRKEGEITFALSHGNYVCNMEYVVFLRFNEDKKLSSAEGRIIQGACL